MPHIVVEYSENLTPAVEKTQLLTFMHKLVIDSGLFAPEAVKARGIGFTHYVLTPPDKSFLHISLSILEGRPIEARQMLSQKMFDLATQLIPHSDKISINIHEMACETYRK